MVDRLGELSMVSAEEFLLGPLVQRRSLLGGVEADIQSFPCGHRVRMPAKGLDQPVLVQRIGPHLQDQRPHLGQRALGDVAQFGQPAGQPTLWIGTVRLTGRSRSSSARKSPSDRSRIASTNVLDNRSGQSCGNRADRWVNAARSWWMWC